MKILEKEVSLITVPEDTHIDDVVARIAVIREDQAQIFFDDNGVEPDGPSWIVPEDDLDSKVVKELTLSGELLVATGDIIAYDGSERDRATLDATYPGGWCGFSSRGEAYGLQSSRPTEFDWGETKAWLQSNPDANPGGHEGADLFEIPLPEDFLEANAIFLDGGQEWGWAGPTETGGWELGESGWIVRPEDAEIWNLFE